MHFEYKLIPNSMHFTAVFFRNSPSQTNLQQDGSHLVVIKARLHSVQGSCGCFYKVSEKVRGKQESLRHIMAPNPKSCWRYFPILCYIYLCFLNKCKNYNWKECSLLNKQTNLWILYLKKKKREEKIKNLEKFWHEGDES